MARKAVTPCVGDGMVVRRVVMRARDVVFFKGIVEASEGLAAVHAERGGDLLVAAPSDRAGSSASSGVREGMKSRTFPAAGSLPPSCRRWPRRSGHASPAP